MMLFLRLIVSALALLLATELIPNVQVDSFYIALIVAVLLGLLNVTLRPLLVMLTLPITILTLGLFLFVINAGILLFVSSFIDGFAIGGFWTAVLVSLFLTVVNWFSHRILK